jgi:hypothetical protein
VQVRLCCRIWNQALGWLHVTFNRVDNVRVAFELVAAVGHVKRVILGTDAPELQGKDMENRRVRVLSIRDLVVL